MNAAVKSAATSINPTRTPALETDLRTQEGERHRDTKKSPNSFEKMTSNKVLTNTFICENGKILLGMKKRGFAEGWWNGFGGKVEPGETIMEAAKRELKEECGVEVDDLTPAGVIMNEFVGDPQLLEIHVFTATKYRGTPTETEEMRPQWFDEDKVPFDKMWPDDVHWYPHMMKGSIFYEYVYFEKMDKIISYTLDQVPTIDSIKIPQKAIHFTS